MDGSLRFSEVLNLSELESILHCVPEPPLGQCNQEYVDNIYKAVRSMILRWGRCKLTNHVPWDDLAANIIVIWSPLLCMVR